MSTPYAPDPFDTSNLLTLPAIHDDTQGAWEGFHFDDSLQNDTFYLPDVKESHLPRLQAGFFELSLDEVPIPSLDASSVSDYATAEEDSYEQDPEHGTSGSDGLEDLWILPSVKDAKTKTVLTSWDHFLGVNHTEPAPAYLSESGVEVFDALVQTVSKTPIKRLKPDTFLSALYELAMGRPSILFGWSASDETFFATVKSSTVTGLTPGIVEKVAEDFKSSGTLFKALRQRQRSASKSRAVIAFDASLRSCLAALETYMGGRRSEAASILAMRYIYERPQLLLGLLSRLSSTIRAAHDDVMMLSEILDQCVSWSLQSPWLTPILHRILAAIFGPVLEQLAAGLGLAAFVDGFHPDESSPFQLLDSQELQQVAKEAHESLALLHKVSSYNITPVASQSVGRAFGLAFSWNELNQCQQNAMRYEVAARIDLLQPFPNDNIKIMPVDTKPSTQAGNVAARNLTQIPEAETDALLDLDAYSSDLLNPDELQQSVLNSLRSNAMEMDVFSVPLDQVIDLSLSPLIFAQHRLLSYSILDLLFSKYRLQSHLHLLRQINLFGDGTFAARLGLALFDNELASGEGHRRTGATTGLRLQTRESWPPASSELRLALMGVLSETLQSSAMADFTEHISFAIRDLSDDELELCRDVDSIHALDFLKIHYKPPSPILEAVLSSDSLERYDRIFKHILRVLRVKSVAQSLLRAVCTRGDLKVSTWDHKFRVEIHHLMSVIADYCHNVAIAAPWVRLQTVMNLVVDRLRARDYDETLQHGKSLEYLRQLHSSVVDDMLRALFLKQKESKAMSALEDIFEVVLRYAASLRRKADSDDDMMATTGRLHDEFRKLVQRFIDQVASASGRGSGRVYSEKELDPFEQLLLMLDFNTYWTKQSYAVS